MRRGILMLLAAAFTASAAYAWELRQEEPEPMVTYVAEVQEGDTVWDLAEKLARPEDDVRRIAWEIRKQNGIRDARNIQPGQVLHVSVPAAK